MDVLNIIISLISGIAGGNIAGASMPDKNLGAVGNSLIGLIGGGAGEFILKALGVIGTSAVTGDPSAAHGLDLTSILGSIAAGGVSGGALTGVIALIKDAIAKKS